jgi:hypothetical protein
MKRVGCRRKQTQTSVQHCIRFTYIETLLGCLGAEAVFDVAKRNSTPTPIPPFSCELIHYTILDHNPLTALRTQAGGKTVPINAVTGAIWRGETASFVNLDTR